MSTSKVSNLQITTNVTFLGIIYTSFLILSNLTASKVGALGEYNFTAVIIFFPVTYIIDDILTEVYGYKVSRKVIWAGLFANLIVVFGSYIVLLVPPSSEWNYQKEFEAVFTMSHRILLASVSAYIGGEFVNSILLAKLKIITKGKHFWFRAIFSTVIGAAFDTSIFMIVAFAYILPAEIIIGMIFVEYVIKILVEVLVLPITVRIVQYLKKVDQIDYYDYGTNFNPFSLK